MVSHQTVCMTDPSEAFDNSIHELNKLPPVTYMEEDHFSTVSPAYDMIQSTFILNAERPGHNAESSLIDTSGRSKGMSKIIAKKQKSKKVRFDPSASA